MTDAPSVIEPSAVMSGKRENAEAQVHAEREQREDQPDRERADEERHARLMLAIGPTQQAPRMTSVSPTPSKARTSAIK